MKKSLADSGVFTKVWFKYFGTKQKQVRFPFISGTTFIKNKFTKIYKSLGGSFLMTNNYYVINNDTLNHFDSKVIVIYNIPSYFDATVLLNDKKIKLLRFKEYQAYIANFTNFNTADHYFKNQLGSKTFGNIRRRQARLEQGFDISYNFFHKELINETLYKHLMFSFRNLLKIKFEQKREYYPVISSVFWDFYIELIHKMIANGEASLFVVFNSDAPISFYLSYHFNTTVMGLIPVFDTDYNKFGLGTITIKKLFEQLFKMDIQKFDFYKGDYGYKKDWCDQVYNYEHHILYDKTMVSMPIAYLLFSMFKVKQYLRAKHINLMYYKLLFFMKNGNKKISENKFIFKEISAQETKSMNLTEINLSSHEYFHLKKTVYNYIYHAKQYIGDIDLYVVNNSSNTFLIENKIKNLFILIK